MENLSHEKMREIVHQDANYFLDKTNLLSTIMNHNIADRKMLDELHDLITGICRSENWSRRKLDCILDEIIRERGREFSDELSNFIMDYLENIEGHVSCDSIVKLNGDPDDYMVLCYYVRSDKWRNEDRYSE